MSIRRGPRVGYDTGSDDEWDMDRGAAVVGGEPPTRVDRINVEESRVGVAALVALGDSDKTDADVYATTSGQSRERPASSTPHHRPACPGRRC